VHYVSESDDEPKEDQEYDQKDYMKHIMMKQNMRLFNTTKEVNRGERKLKAMEKTKGGVSHLLQKSFVVKIYLCNVRPEIWRRVIVPASIPLSALHDKVICPVMGWCRNYHGYYFAELPRPKQSHLKPWDREVGEVFGPINSGAVDMMHCGLHGIHLADDRKVALAQILNDVNKDKPGNKILYVYDIGDTYRHKLILEEIRDVEKGDEGLISVLDGANACPPEDGGGNFSYAKTLSKLDKGPSHSSYRETMSNANHSANYRLTHDFDPKKFDLKRTRIILNETLKTSPSKNDASNMFSMNFLTGQPSGGETLGMEKLSIPSKECTVCGATQNLKRCSKCHVVYYCGREHQTQDWKRHKKECQKDINSTIV